MLMDGDGGWKKTTRTMEMDEASGQRTVADWTDEHVLGGVVFRWIPV